MIARGWLVALTIFAVGLAEGDEAGLSAAVLVIVLFTVYFAVRMILRPFEAARTTARHRPDERLSRATRYCSLVGLYLVARHPVYVISRQRGQERGLQAPERVQARPLDHDQDRRARPQHQQGRALPVARLRRHDRRR